jgi:hypothetical protein
MRGHKSACIAAAGLVALITWTDVTGSWERDKTCVYATADDVVSRMASLATALTAGDAEAAAANYSPDAILMGLGDQAIRLGRAEIASFYSDPLHRPAVETLSQTLESSCSVAAVSGTQRYRWSSNGVASTVVYRVILGLGSNQWLIVHHHSELLAGTLPEAPAIAARPSSPPDLTTGSTRPAVTDELILPPPAFELPNAPPVFIQSSRPELLLAPTPRAAASAGTAASALKPILIPALPQALVGQPLPAALATRAPPSPLVAAQPIPLPRLSLDLPPLPVATMFTPSLPLARLQPAVAAAGPEPKAVAVAVIVPPLPIVLGDFPLAAASAEVRRVQPSTTVADTKRAAEPRAKVDAASSGKSDAASSPPVRSPQVASFAKRAEPPKPPAISKPAASNKSSQAKAAPKAAAAVPAAPAQPVYPAYRPGRWVSGVPVFGD